jgi:hypothetical protein
MAQLSLLISDRSNPPPGLESAIGRSPRTTGRQDIPRRQRRSRGQNAQTAGAPRRPCTGALTPTHVMAGEGRLQSSVTGHDGNCAPPDRTAVRRTLCATGLEGRPHPGAEAERYGHRDRRVYTRPAAGNSRTTRRHCASPRPPCQICAAAGVPQACVNEAKKRLSSGVIGGAQGSPSVRLGSVRTARYSRGTVVSPQRHVTAPSPDRKASTTAISRIGSLWKARPGVAVPSSTRSKTTLA